MSKLIKIYIIAILPLILSGCIAFKKSSLSFKQEEVKSVNIGVSNKIKLFINWDLDFMPTQYSNMTHQDRKDIFKNVLQEFNCCELVDKKSQSNLFIDIKAYSRVDPWSIVGWIITAVSLHTIPSWHQSEMFIEAKVIANNEHYNYNIVGDSIVTAIWAPFIFATPFAFDLDKIHKESLEDAYRRLLIEMNKDNLF